MISPPTRRSPLFRAAKARRSGSPSAGCGTPPGVVKIAARFARTHRACLEGLRLATGGDPENRHVQRGLERDRVILQKGPREVVGNSLMHDMLRGLVGLAGTVVHPDPEQH